VTDLRAATDAVEARIKRASSGDIPSDRRRDVKRPPGPNSALATARLLRRDDATAEFMCAVERQYDSLAHTRVLGQHLYLLTSPEAVLEVMQTHGRDTMKGRALQGAKALLGNGLLTSEGDEHIRNRRLVQPAFHRERIAGYADDMVRRSVTHGQSWKAYGEVDIVADMSALTLAIVGDTLFDVDLAGDARDVGEALTGVLQGAGGRLMFGASAMRIPTPGRRRALEDAARLEGVVQRLIAEHRTASDRGDILSMLVAAQEDGVGLSDEQVRDEVMSLMLAGHETTAIALSWSWLLLAGNPAVADWWHEELDTVLADREPTFADLGSLPRTQAIVAESIRLFSPAWIMGRRLLTDLEVDGWTLPRGTMVLASMFAVQRSERWWDQPARFVPSRWITPEGAFDESAPGQPRGAWFAFGFGNRRCIGEQFAWSEAMLVLATLGRHWQPERVGTSPVLLRPNITMRPAGDTRMRLVPRG